MAEMEGITVSHFQAANLAVAFFTPRRRGCGGPVPSLNSARDLSGCSKGTHLASVWVLNWINGSSVFDREEDAEQPARCRRSRR